MLLLYSFLISWLLDILIFFIFINHKRMMLKIILKGKIVIKIKINSKSFTSNWLRRWVSSSFLLLIGSWTISFMVMLSIFMFLLFFLLFLFLPSFMMFLSLLFLFMQWFWWIWSFSILLQLRMKFIVFSFRFILLPFLRYLLFHLKLIKTLKSMKILYFSRRFSSDLNFHFVKT